jgi:hypothetical protein
MMNLLLIILIELQLIKTTQKVEFWNKDFSTGWTTDGSEFKSQ